MHRFMILWNIRDAHTNRYYEEYGKLEDNFNLIAQLWSVYMNTSFMAKDVAMMMALLKIARIKTGVKADSYVDLAGYAACCGEIDANNRVADNTCVSCGATIPEGRHICPDREKC